MPNRYNPNVVWKPFGSFSMAAVQGSGKTIHLKGQVSLDIDGQVIGEEDMEVQVETSLENIRLVLSEFGGQMQDIYSMTHHVTDIEAFMKAGDVRTRYFSPPYPVTTTVEVSRLYHPLLLVEITVSAEIPTQRFSEPTTNVD